MNTFSTVNSPEMIGENELNCVLLCFLQSLWPETELEELYCNKQSKTALSQIIDESYFCVKKQPYRCYYAKSPNVQDAFQHSLSVHLCT